MNEAPHPDLQRALVLSADMLQAGRRGDWAGATALQAECDHLLRQAPINAAGLMALRQLQLDQRTLLDLAVQARTMVSEHLARHHVNHRAVSAYLDAADPG
ncbi:hypothetical protein ISP17_07515 [Dyella ginsengisoli]|uniref:Flagellar protein FliT n=1 Tax=Dyella ginsengisoli TaxID=363848 RepID=A0ABW8JRS0_9GAMM